MSQVVNNNGKVNSLQPSNVEAVDVSATDVVFGEPRTLYIGVTGDVKVDGASSGTETYTNVAVGFFPILVTKVYNSGTDASGIISQY